MGDYRIEVKGTGAHGCAREPKEGQDVYGCNRMDCPDCLTRDFVARLNRIGTFGLEATLTHWPGTEHEVVDRIVPTDNGGARVTRERGSF